MTSVAPRIVNDVSYVTRIKHACHFSWQAQYSVKVTCHFSWQVQYLVKVRCYFLVKVKCHFSWQAQYLVKVKRHFSWQVQYLVPLFVAGAVLGEIWKDSRSAKCCIFQCKMVVLSAKSKLCCAAGCGRTGTVSEPSRILLGSAAHWK